ncbi:amino acid ABC transporter substrate-binding protein [Colwellia sp. BRX10-3]|uniref:substrate-binding periplasmic protein n=1 Tax=Colwellia sp. BRX10-3 TaxID=2759844 RepID=UPI0015F72920|nr:transporter substrate-binding domain-containing protein [Colwellia sp. BRX10-3]MBA6390862.1 amino acid ABC transporter substrate-binding protein [Colwellia sp. BRX10-3]
MKNFLLLICLIINFTSHAKDLQVGWELWFPYQYRNSQQELVGLDFEIFNTILAKVGYTTAYTELPWKRHLHYLKTGEMDVAMGASKSEERLRYAMYSQSYRQETVNLFVRNGEANTIKLVTLNELAGSDYMIGIESGYYYGDEYKALMKTAEFQEHIIEVVDIEENVTLLLAGHIDGFLVDPTTIKAFSNKYKMNGEFEKHSLNIYQAEIHMMFSKKSVKPTVVKAIDQAISDLKKSGELDNIINKWSKLN